MCIMSNTVPFVFQRCESQSGGIAPADCMKSAMALAKSWDWIRQMPIAQRLQHVAAFESCNHMSKPKTTSCSKNECIEALHRYWQSQHHGC
eukprot:scaffold1431_cov346-Pavlova_lutheri.AAC.10